MVDGTGRLWGGRRGWRAGGREGGREGKGEFLEQDISVDAIVCT
jgi:hypothetical protein